MIRSLLAVGLLVLMPSIVAKAGEVEKELAKLSTQLTDAVLKSDTAYLASALSDDWTIIVDNGGTMDKPAYLKHFKDGDLKFEKLEKADIKVRVYGDSALVIALDTYKLFHNGHEHNATSRATEVFVKRDGKWLCVAVQLTRLAPDAPEKL